MYRGVFRTSSLILLAAAASVTASAQQNTCDLRLKVYSYDAAESPRSRLQNVQVRIRGRGVDKTQNLGLDTNNAFANLRDGSYEAEFSKSGYTKRKKRITLNCPLKDETNAVWDHTYLWRDKKLAGVEADLVEDAKDDSGNVPGSAGIGSRDVASAAANKLVGSVKLNITIDEDGNVIAASRVDGDERLAARAILMARRAKFTPTLLSGSPQKVTGNITYNFVP